MSRSKGQNLDGLRTAKRHRTLPREDISKGPKRTPSPKQMKVSPGCAHALHHRSKVRITAQFGKVRVLSDTDQIGYMSLQGLVEPVERTALVP